ncbi:ead/Ea22-like family protein [Enterobacter roggenkampii]|uniref:ead/Ea22-like family protein n=1 Tax=Enterobacter roggenkampii TaxID=1812935 RepID=UPI00244AA789|nr:ead/Ea22-like family protein [Enterobacter roggenkampii]MDH1653739.1 ead/Ea22-like family protein [Enterobacter roggenkampii]
MKTSPQLETTPVKELVAAGHALAKELHCAESAALVRNLATALDVQFARANALTVVDVCDPNVLALLDELEAADALNKHLELAIRKAEGCSEALRRKAEAAEKRITELESREITMPPYSFFDFKLGSPFKSGAYCHIDSVNKELSKHGIKMTAAAGKG